MNSNPGQIFPPLVKKYSDFGGRKLKIGTIDYPHTFVRLEESEDGTLIPKGGIDIALMTALGEKHNFT